MGKLALAKIPFFFFLSLSPPSNEKQIKIESINSKRKKKNCEGFEGLRMWCKMGREKKKLTVNGGVIRAWSVGRCGENGTRDFGGWSWMEFADCSRSSTR